MLQKVFNREVGVLFGTFGLFIIGLCIYQFADGIESKNIISGTLFLLSLFIGFREVFFRS